MTESAETVRTNVRKFLHEELIESHWPNEAKETVKEFLNEFESRTFQDIGRKEDEYGAYLEGIFHAGQEDSATKTKARELAREVSERIAKSRLEPQRRPVAPHVSQQQLNKTHQHQKQIQERLHREQLQQQQGVAGKNAIQQFWAEHARLKATREGKAAVLQDVLQHRVKNLQHRLTTGQQRPTDQAQLEKYKRYLDFVRKLLEFFKSDPNSIQIKEHDTTLEKLRTSLEKLDELERHQFEEVWNDNHVAALQRTKRLIEFFRTSADPEKGKILGHLATLQVLFEKTPAQQHAMPQYAPQRKLSDLVTAIRSVPRWTQHAQKLDYFTFRDQQATKFKAHLEMLITQVKKQMSVNPGSTSKVMETLKKELQVTQQVWNKLFQPATKYPQEWVNKEQLTKELQLVTDLITAKAKAAQQAKSNAAAATAAAAAAAAASNVKSQAGRAQAGRAQQVGKVQTGKVYNTPVTNTTQPPGNSGTSANRRGATNANTSAARNADSAQRPAPADGASAAQPPAKRPKIKEFFHNHLPDLQKDNPQVVDQAQTIIEKILDTRDLAPPATATSKQASCRKWFQSYHPPAPMPSTSATLLAPTLPRAETSTDPSAVSDDSHRFVVGEVRNLVYTPGRLDIHVLHHPEGGSDITITADQVLALPSLHVHALRGYPLNDASYRVVMPGGHHDTSNIASEFEYKMISLGGPLKVGFIARHWIKLVEEWVASLGLEDSLLPSAAVTKTEPVSAEVPSAGK